MVMKKGKAMPSKSEHEYRGWKIRITDKAVDARFSERIEVWKPGDDPRSYSGINVPFLKRAASRVEARAAATQEAKKWIDREMETTQ
jgi:hypothetical protein